MTGQRAAQRFCHKCGAEIPKDSAYCRVCGYSKADRLGNARETSKDQKKKISPS